MKLMFPNVSRVSSFLTLLILSLTITANLDAQSKKNSSSNKKAVAKKNDTKAKDAKKGRDDKRASVRDKRDNKKDKSTNNKRDSKRDAAKKDNKRDNEDKKVSRADRKKADAESRRREAERRAAIAEERRRREIAAREARERKLAFERGLRSETEINIQRDDKNGEDLNIRAAAISALGNHAGSVVVMEAQTGKVLTIVNQDWAVRSTIRPCSTIKLVTGVAGLNEGVISKEDGSVRNVSTRRHLDDAIAFSDNGYFQRAGMQMGNQKLVEYGQRLGLGQPTGINLSGEAPGRLPYSNSNARIYSHGDDTEVSTLQLAVLASEITNGGRKIIPHIPRSNNEQVNYRGSVKGMVDVPAQNMRRVIPGMMGAASYGTARRNMDQSLGVAGKTGSCIDKGSWVGLFASVAPVENPKYAVAVITRGQSERGRAAAAVAADVYRALARGIVRTDRNLAQTEFHIMPKNASRISAGADEDEDGDDVDTSTTASIPQNVIVVPSAPTTLSNPDTSTRGKLVTRTADSRPVNKPVQKAAVQPMNKPLFAPIVITPGQRP
jgi:penicillin-binding protein 2